MRDWIFTGTSIEEALVSASQTLGIPAEEIAYLVLETGHAAVAAKIAVLAENVQRNVAENGGQLSALASTAPEHLVKNALEALERASGVAIKAILRADEQGLEVSIECEDEEFLWGERGEVFDALNLLLSRALNRGDRRENVRIIHQGVLQRRMIQIETLARDTAERAHDEGITQVLSGLNSFERRIVHLTLQDQPDVWTKSEGEGDERRLIVGITRTERIE